MFSEEGATGEKSKINDTTTTPFITLGRIHLLTLIMSSKSYTWPDARYKTLNQFAVYTLYIYLIRYVDDAVPPFRATCRIDEPSSLAVEITGRVLRKRSMLRVLWIGMLLGGRYVKFVEKSTTNYTISGRLFSIR